jgi:hypothetical protein
LALLLCLAVPSAQAVLFYSTADPAYNTTPPTGTLVNSGWQFEGFWGSFLGTVIGPSYFITAHHVGGNVGDPFVFQGTTYTTTAFYDHSASDLRIWSVQGSFPTHAPLYTKSNEAGQGLVVFGRGTQRGQPVTVPGVIGAVLRGWEWGVADGLERWGQNQVESIQEGDKLAPPGSNVAIGEVLTALFNAGGGPNEAHLSIGDSGGAVFIRDGTIWKLAGINYAVDGPYNTNDSGAGFEAAIFNEDGLYVGQEGNWTLTPDSPTPQPGAFYATRISAHITWIQSILSQTVSTAPVLQSAPAPAGPYTGETTAQIDTSSNSATLPLPSATRFYRLNASTALTFQSIQVTSTGLLFKW